MFHAQKIYNFFRFFQLEAGIVSAYILHLLLLTRGIGHAMGDPGSTESGEESRFSLSSRIPLFYAFRRLQQLVVYF